MKVPQLLNLAMREQEPGGREEEKELFLIPGHEKNFQIHTNIMSSACSNNEFCFRNCPVHG